MGASPGDDVTVLLRAWHGGDQAALARLAERVYAELHRVAHRYMRNERRPDTLQTRSPEGCSRDSSEAS